MRAYAALDRLVLLGFDEVATASPTVARTLDRWGVYSSLVENGVEIVAVILIEHVERAPGAIGGRDRVGLEPAADGVLVKIVPGFDRRIKVGGIDGTAGAKNETEGGQ